MQLRAVVRDLDRHQWLQRSAPVALLAAAALALAACSSSTTPSASNNTVKAKSPAPASSSSSAPGARFSTATVTGLGTVVVDGRGRTVYVLTADGHTNLPCTDATGCTKYWPDLPLPDGVTSATAGTGVPTGVLATMKLSDGKAYPTYKGWLVYEYAGDTSSGQASGQDVRSFGGTWYVLGPSGDPITTPASSGAGSGSGGSSGGSSGGYGY